MTPSSLTRGGRDNRPFSSERSYLLTERITSQLRQSRTSVYASDVRNVRAMLVRDLYNELFACEERRWEFHIEYQRLFGVPHAIHQFGQSQGRSRSIV